MKLSIITATYNSAQHLTALITSLKSQTCSEFEWIVVDGGSTDETVSLLVDASNFITMKYVSEKDFGIYHALNKGIEMSSGEFYLVIGSDDTLHIDAVSNYVNAIDDSHDMFTASVRHGQNILKVNKKSSSIVGAWAIVSCHSVGTVFKKSLHKKFGYYSRQFPIAADQLFIKTAFNGGAKVKQLDFIAGEFGDSGVSSVNVLGHISETFRVQYSTESNKNFQFFMYILRLIKNRLLGKF